MAGSWASAPTATRPTATLPTPLAASIPAQPSNTAGPSTSATATAAASQDSFRLPVPPVSTTTAAGARQSASRAPNVHSRPMMHPIMAAAYNAALVELSESCDQQRTFTNVTSATGRQQSIPFALSTPLHLSDPNPHVSNAAHSTHHGINTGPAAPAGQTIVINTNSVHLTGNNAESLANLISRANVRLRVMPNGQRIPVGTAGAAAAAAAAGQAPGQGVGAGRGAAGGFRGAMAGMGGGPAFQRQNGGGWRLQLQFQLNVMQILRLGMAVLFMHSVMQMPTLRIVLLLTGYFVGRAFIGMRMHRAFTSWLDSVIAYTRQPMGRPQPAAPPAPPGAPVAREGAAPAPGGDGGVAAGAAVMGAPPAPVPGGVPGGVGAAQDPAAPAVQPPQQEPQVQPGVLWQIWVGILSFFLSMLPQFNADGADAAAIAAAQEDLANEQNNGGGDNQAAVF